MRERWYVVRNSLFSAPVTRPSTTASPRIVAVHLVLARRAASIGHATRAPVSIVSVPSAASRIVIASAKAMASTTKVMPWFDSAGPATVATLQPLEHGV